MNLNNQKYRRNKIKYYQKKQNIIKLKINNN